MEIIKAPTREAFIILLREFPFGERRRNFKRY